MEHTSREQSEETDSGFLCYLLQAVLISSRNSVSYCIDYKDVSDAFCFFAHFKYSFVEVYHGVSFLYHVNTKTPCDFDRPFPLSQNFQTHYPPIIMSSVLVLALFRSSNVSFNNLIHFSLQVVSFLTLLILKWSFL